MSNDTHISAILPPDAVRALRERELLAAYAELGAAQASEQERYPDDNADGLDGA